MLLPHLYPGATVKRNISTYKPSLLQLLLAKPFKSRRALLPNTSRLQIAQGRNKGRNELQECHQVSPAMTSSSTGYACRRCCCICCTPPKHRLRCRRKGATKNSPVLTLQGEFPRSSAFQALKWSEGLRGRFPATPKLPQPRVATDTAKAS